MKKKALSSKAAVFPAFFAALICVSAWICIPAAVPFTMQTFAVSLCGVLLGAKRGAAAVCIYILLGIIGLPVFSGFKSGAAVLLGATGGYTLGFIPLAAIPGFFCSHFGRKLPVMLISMTAGLLVCYAFGTAWYMAVYLSSPKSLGAVLSSCVLPFIIPDIIKVFLATLCSKKAEKFIK